MSPLADLLVGIFVGGSSRRMGRPKGLLNEPRGTRSLVERLIAEVEEAFPSAPWVFVGKRPEYALVAGDFLDDAVPETGPLGGLVALTEEASRQGCACVLALGCDFPHLTASLLQRLVQTAPEASVVAPWLDDRWQPLVARYDVRATPVLRAALSEGRFGLQPLLHQLGCAPFEPKEGERRQLWDWDEPGDIERLI